MDDSHNPDRVDNFLAWRFVRALEGIEGTLSYFRTVFIVTCFVYLFYNYFLRSKEK